MDNGRLSRDGSKEVDEWFAAKTAEIRGDTARRVASLKVANKQPIVDIATESSRKRKSHGVGNADIHILYISRYIY